MEILGGQVGASCARSKGPGSAGGERRCGARRSRSRQAVRRQPAGQWRVRARFQAFGPQFRCREQARNPRHTTDCERRSQACPAAARRPTRRDSGSVTLPLSKSAKRLCRLRGLAARAASTSMRSRSTALLIERLVPAAAGRRVDARTACSHAQLDTVASVCWRSTVEDLEAAVGDPHPGTGVVDEDGREEEVRMVRVAGPARIPPVTHGD